MEGGLVRFFQSKGKDLLEILMLLVSTVCVCAHVRMLATIMVINSKCY